MHLRHGCRLRLMTSRLRPACCRQPHAPISLASASAIASCSAHLAAAGRLGSWSPSTRPTCPPFAGTCPRGSGAILPPGRPPHWWNWRRPPLHPLRRPLRRLGPLLHLPPPSPTPEAAALPGAPPPRPRGHATLHHLSCTGPVAPWRDGPAPAPPPRPCLPRWWAQGVSSWLPGTCAATRRPNCSSSSMASPTRPALSWPTFCRRLISLATSPLWAPRPHTGFCSTPAPPPPLMRASSCSFTLQLRCCGMTPPPPPWLSSSAGALTLFTSSPSTCHP